MTGPRSRLPRIDDEVPNPFAQHVLVHFQITRCLGPAHPTVLDQANRLNLERLYETPNLGVHETGSRPWSL